MTNEVTVIERNELAPMTTDGIFLDVQLFEHGQRVAKMLSASTMVPEQFRNNVGNCMIALNFASRAKLDPFMVMQKMYIIQGRPGIEGQLAIALINNSGRFTPLRFRFEGTGKDRKCTAFAKDKKTGENYEQVVTWEMVDKEGWNKKPGSKWNTLPDLMFQYRAAAFFGRLYCPEALLGMMTKEELTDIEPPPVVTRSLSEKLSALANKEEPNPLHQTAAWKDWVETLGLFPEYAAGMDPKTEQECSDCVKAIKQRVDAEMA